MPVATAVPIPTSETDAASVHVRIGGRWIAGHALSRRTAQTGAGEVLISHHGHLVWVDETEIREP